MPGPNFCRRPFTDINVEPSGKITPCCLIYPRPGNDKQGFNESDVGRYLESGALKQLQSAFERGERPPDCQNCWNNEASGLPSLRINRAPRESTKDWKFSEVHIKTSSVCNFKCRICRPYHSSSLLKEQQANGMKLDEYISLVPVSGVQYALRNKELRQTLLEKVIPNANTIRISGGEPLLCADTLEFFRDLLRSGLNRKHYFVFTNLSVLKFAGVDYLDFWRDFPQLRLIVSCDGAEQSAEYSRSGLVWSNFLKNLELARERVAEINCVLSIYSVYSIPNLLRIAGEYNIPVNVEPVFRKAMSLQILPEDEKRKIAQFYEELRASSGPEFEKVFNIVTGDLWGGDLAGGASPKQFKILNEELDRRRGTSFGESNPELAAWYRGL